MNDRFMRGFLSGLVAGIAMDAIDLTLFWLKIDTVRFLDYASVISFEKKASGPLEVILALVIELVFKASLGALFVYIIPNLKSKYLIIKGGLFGVATWFSIYAVILLTKATKFPKLDVGGSLSQLANSLIYGIVLSIMLIWLNNRNDVEVK